MRRARPWQEVLLERVDRRGPDECWPVTKGRGARGTYGMMNGHIDGKYVKKNTHVWAWMLANDTVVPPGMMICHSCDNPPCCNPAHLWLGTAQDNMDDKCRKGRQSRVGHPSYSRPPLLSEDMIDQLKQRWAAGGITVTQLAQAFGVSRATAWRYATGSSRSQYAT